MPPSVRLRLLLAVPVVVALGAGGVASSGSAWGAASDPPGGIEATADDPLGEVVDRDALDDPATIEAGRDLYEVGCVSCHGIDGQGGRGPSLLLSGAASAHFYLTTGRMPAVDLDAQARRKPSPYTPEEIEALVAYVASISEGPEIPEVDLDDVELSEGTSLFLTNCAACHQAAGSGGALSYGRNAPALNEATPVQVATAMRIGPGQMPVFGPDSFDDEQVNAIAAYVDYLRDPADPGGFSLGRIGPVTEGFVSIVLGGGAALVAAAWIGKRRLQTSDDDDVSARR